MNLTDEDIKLLAVEVAGNASDVIARWKNSHRKGDTWGLEVEMYDEIQRIMVRTTSRPIAGFKISPVIIKPDQERIVAEAKKLQPYNQYF